MKDKDAPRNEEGQRPTRTTDETIERLEQKKKQDHGTANKQRIEKQERDVKSRR